jgi:hypothetical protein
MSGLDEGGLKIDDEGLRIVPVMQNLCEAVA